MLETPHLPTPTERPPTTRPRRQWLAFVLGFFAPGLGHLYAGSLSGTCAALAVFFVGMPLAFWFGVFFVARSLPTTLGLFAAILLTIWIVLPLHGALIARRRRLLPLRAWNRTWVYAAYAILFFAINRPVFRAVVTNWYRVGSIGVSRIPAKSMEPSVLLGDYLVIDRRSRALGSLRAGDIVVVESPSEPGAWLTKRLVGLPGQKVEGREGTLYVNDANMRAGRGSETMGGVVYGIQPDNWDYEPFWIPEDSFFVLGDNRPRSLDSRTFGPISRALIRGRVVRIFWSWDAEKKEVRWDRIGLDPRGSLVQKD